MSNVINVSVVPSQVAHPVKAVLRTVVQVAVPSLITVAAIIGIIAGNQTIASVLPEGWVVWLLAAAGLLTASAGALTAIFALPGVNAFLTTVGLGAAPKGSDNVTEAFTVPAVPSLVGDQTDLYDWSILQEPAHIDYDKKFADAQVAEDEAAENYYGLPNNIRSQIAEWKEDTTPAIDEAGRAAFLALDVSGDEYEFETPVAAPQITGPIDDVQFTQGILFINPANNVIKVQPTVEDVASIPQVNTKPAESTTAYTEYLKSQFGAS